MSRGWAGVIVAVALLAAGLGCNDPNSPWHHGAKKPRVQGAAAPSRNPAGDGHEPPSEPVALNDKPDVSPPSNTHQRVQEFLERIEGNVALSGESEAAPVAGRSDAHADVAWPETNISAAPGSTATATNEELDLSNAATGAPAPNGGAVEAPRVEALVIRASSAAPEETEDSSETVGVNTSLGTDNDPEAESLSELIGRLQEHVAEAPNDLTAQWKLSLLQLADGRETDATDVSSGITRESGEMIAGAIRVVDQVRRATQDPGPAVDHALAAVDDLRHQLMRGAELLIPKVALCTRVSTFGVYDEMDHAALLPYHPNRTIVYCELDNFHSEPTSDGEYQVTLSSRLEILTPDGQSLWNHEEPRIEDRSKQRREDFFLAQLVTFPASLGPGDYVLKVTVEDQGAAKATEAVYPFQIDAPAVSTAIP
jgi:hypothetical protein